MHSTKSCIKPEVITDSHKQSQPKFELRNFIFTEIQRFPSFIPASAVYLPKHLDYLYTIPLCSKSQEFASHALFSSS